MTEQTIIGNYLTEHGEPVLATQVPPVSGETPIGGYIVALGWTCRWIKALAPDVEPIYSEGKLCWEHNGKAHAARPTQWIVWDQGVRFKVVPPGYFNSFYKPVNFTAALGKEQK